MVRLPSVVRSGIIVVSYCAAIGSSQCGDQLTQADALAELRSYVEQLRNNSAYYHFQQIDLTELQATAAEKISMAAAGTGGSIDRCAFDQTLQVEVQSHLQDVRASVVQPQPPFSPFLIFPVGGSTPSGATTYVAVNVNRTDFLDAAYPFLTQIDGHDVSDWLGAAKQLTNTDDPTTGLLRLGELRRLLLLPASDSVTLSLGNSAGLPRSQSLILATTNTMPTAGLWPRDACRYESKDADFHSFLKYEVIEDKVGYLRFRTMAADTSNMNDLCVFALPSRTGCAAALRACRSDLRMN